MHCIVFPIYLSDLYVTQYFIAQRGAKGRRAFAASRLSAGLDADLATECCKQNGEKLPNEETGDARCKSERNKEERETQKHAVRKKR